jgi:hypothetical protein
MILSIGLENNMDGRSLAWALDFPGCYADGPDAGAALMTAPQAFVKYLEWAARHDSDSWLNGISDFDVRLVDTFDGYFINPETFEPCGKAGIEINAWFRHDWKPLSQLEIQRGLQLLEWSRADLLEAVTGLSDAQLDAPHPGERWSIRGVLNHVASAEYYYLQRMDLAGPALQPDPHADPLAQLGAVRGLFESCLPGLAGSRQVLGKEGEFWSPRKLLRRAIWHERDHTGHIYKLLLA